MEMRYQYLQLQKRQRGAVAVVVGIAIFVLVGMIGLALDSGQLFVNKTELQNAADACALAAARELDGNTDSLTRADAAGVLVGTQNLVGFQKATVTLTNAQIRYGENLSPNDSTNYRTSAYADSGKARFVMCSIERTNIDMWFMGVFGYNESKKKPKVGAYAVATLAPSQTSCALPIGFCENHEEPLKGCTNPDKYGLCVGDWRNGRFDSGGGANGAFNWIDFVDKAGGTPDLNKALITGICDLAGVGEVKYAEPGVSQATAKAWNSRFGLYFPDAANPKGAGNPSQTGTTPAMPDWTGFSYTATSWLPKRDAFKDFLGQRAEYAVAPVPYQGDAVTGLTLPGSYKSNNTPGADRRVVPVPMIDCDAWDPSKVVKILDWACVLLLHPIGNPTGEVTMEYLGLASKPGSPCASQGLAGGSFGPLVPVLVQ